MAKGRVVNLVDLGIKGNSLSAYKGADDKYYSSEEAYSKISEDKEYWRKSMDKLMEILDYEPKMKLPSIAAKKFSEIRGFGMKNVYDTICKCENDGVFDYPKTIEFSNEYGKVAYYSTIIVNKVMDTYKNNKLKQEVAKTEHINPMESEIVYNNTSKKKKDISRFLED